MTKSWSGNGRRTGKRRRRLLTKFSRVRIHVPSQKAVESLKVGSFSSRHDVGVIAGDLNQFLRIVGRFEVSFRVVKGDQIIATAVRDQHGDLNSRQFIDG